MIVSDSLTHFVGTVLTAWFILDAWGALSNWYLFGFFWYVCARHLVAIRARFTIVCFIQFLRVYATLSFVHSFLPASIEFLYIARVLLCKVGKF